MKSANVTITGYEVMRMFKKGQFDLLMNAKAVNEAQFINQLFDVYASIKCINKLSKTS